jgi:hypothetical protein
MQQLAQGLLFIKTLPFESNPNTEEKKTDYQNRLPYLRKHRMLFPCWMGPALPHLLSNCRCIDNG